MRMHRFWILSLLLLAACAVSEVASKPDAAAPAEPGLVQPGASDPEAGIFLGHGPGDPSGGGGGASSDGGAAAGLVINEVDYAQPSTDSREFIELYNSSAGSINLSSLAVVLVGSNDAEYSRFDLTGTIGPGQYLVIASSTVPVPDAGPVKVLFKLAANNVRNGGPAGIAIVDKVGETLVDSLSYAGELTTGSVNGIVAPFNFVEGTATTAVDSDTKEGALIRQPNGTDTNDNAADWKFSTTRSPGTANIFTP